MTAKSSKKNTKYVYTCSSRSNMVELLEKSICSLKKYVDSQDVVVYFTPPINRKDIETLENLGVDVRERSHFDESRQITGFDLPGHYSDKAYLTEIQSENIVFLDCDTLVIQDIREVVKGDFKFRARTVGNISPAWGKFLHEYNTEYVFPEVNAGFLIFKKGFHRKIAEDYRHFLSQDLSEGWSNKSYNHDQFALSLSVANRISTGSDDFEEMSSLEHRFAWNEEELNKSVYVFHRDDNTKTDLIGSISASLDSRLPLNFEKISAKTRKVING